MLECYTFHYIGNYLGIGLYHLPNSNTLPVDHESGYVVDDNVDLQAVGTVSHEEGDTVQVDHFSASTDVHVAGNFYILGCSPSSVSVS